MRKKNLFIFMAIAIWIIMVGEAMAQRHRLEIPFYDRHFFPADNYEQKLYLKNEIRNHYPGFDLTDTQLHKVVLIAKSKFGRGKVRLRVGRHYSEFYRVYGHPQDFYNLSRATFDRIKIKNPTNDSRGPWQIQLKGNFIIRKVVVILKERAYRHDRRRNHPPYNNNSQWQAEPRRDKPWGYESWENSHQNPDRRNNRREEWYDNSNNRHDGNWNEPRPAHRSFQLNAKSWGTEIEREKRCGQPSDNTSDGWNSPQNICTPSGTAGYVHGYPPTRLYMRPDVSSFSASSRNQRIHRLKITIKAKARKRRYHSHETSTFGISIAGRQYTQTISHAPQGSKNHKIFKVSKVINGNWSTRDLANATVWVKPNQQAGDFNIKQLLLTVLETS